MCDRRGEAHCPQCRGQEALHDIQAHCIAHHAPDLRAAHAGLLVVDGLRVESLEEHEFIKGDLAPEVGNPVIALRSPGCRDAWELVDGVLPPRLCAAQFHDDARPGRGSLPEAVILPNSFLTRFLCEGGPVGSMSFGSFTGVPLIRVHKGNTSPKGSGH